MSVCTRRQRFTRRCTSIDCSLAIDFTWRARVLTVRAYVCFVQRASNRRLLYGKTWNKIGFTNTHHTTTYLIRINDSTLIYIYKHLIINLNFKRIHRCIKQICVGTSYWLAFAVIFQFQFRVFDLGGFGCCCSLCRRYISWGEQHTRHFL